MPLTGQLTNGGGGLARVPIVDLRGYRDQLPAGDRHLKFHSFSLREWLRKENGTAENDVLLVSSSSVTALTQYAIEKDRARETGGFGGLLLQTGR
jgi:hypothetical protein